MKLFKYIFFFCTFFLSVNVYSDLLEDAQNGDAEAQYRIGWKTLYKDKGNDKAEAIKWLLKSAEQGYPQAQYALADAYRSGKGVEKDNDKFVEWLTKAAQGGMRGPQFQLAEIYLEGRVVPQDMEQGRFWLEKSAEQNHSKAQLYLANFYFKGIGVEQDLDKAKQLLLQAAETDAQAQYIIGESYYYGDYVAKDKAEAKKWFEKASDNGYEYALDFLARHYSE